MSNLTDKMQVELVEWPDLARWQVASAARAAKVQAIQQRLATIEGSLRTLADCACDFADGLDGLPDYDGDFGPDDDRAFGGGGDGGGGEEPGDDFPPDAPAFCGNEDAWQYYADAIFTYDGFFDYPLWRPRMFGVPETGPAHTSCTGTFNPVPIPQFPPGSYRFCFYWELIDQVDTFNFISRQSGTTPPVIDCNSTSASVRSYAAVGLYTEIRDISADTDGQVFRPIYRFSRGVGKNTPVEARCWLKIIPQ